MDRTSSFTSESGGTRVDRFTVAKCPELSRTYIQKLIDEGFITINGQTTRPGRKLEPGDKVEITVPPPAPSPLTPQAMPLKILYEDDDVLVIDKPAGLTVHPAPGHTDSTLVNAIIAHFPRLADISDSLRPGIVHRLDKDTSGVILVAKNKAAQSNLIAQFKARTVVKVYFALVKGRLKPEKGIIEASIGRDTRDRKRMAVSTKGRPAHTGYKVVRYVGDCTLLEVAPKTGRTHQIRVHLAAIGYPLIGDAVYGVKSPYLSRQFLHAARLGFKLPSTGEYVEFKAELPPDLERALKALG